MNKTKIKQSQKFPSVQSFINQKLNDRFLIIQKIKLGKFGGIFKAIDQNQDQKSYVNVKIVDMRKINQYCKEYQNQILLNQRKATINRQIFFLQNLTHHKIVSFVKFYDQEDYKIIITNYCNDGTLADLLNKCKYLQIDHAVNIIQEISLAISEMHLSEKAHTCLKPESVYIHNGACYIGDFGITDVIMGTDDEQITQPTGLNRQKYKLNVDFYSLGVLLYIMINNNSSIVQKAHNIKYQQFDKLQWTNIPIQAKIFISKCLNSQEMTWVKFKDSDIFKQENKSQEIQNIYYPQYKIEKANHISDSKIKGFRVTCYFQQTQNSNRSSSISLLTQSQQMQIVNNNLSLTQLQFYNKKKYIHLIAKRCEFVFKKILLQTQNLKPFNLQSLQNIKILYMISTRCFFDTIQINKNLKILKQNQEFEQSLIQKIKKLTESVTKKFNIYSQKLKQSQAKILNMVKYGIQFVFTHTKTKNENILFNEYQTQDSKKQHIKWVQQALLKSLNTNQKILNPNMLQLHERFKIYSQIYNFDLKKQKEVDFNQYIKKLIAKNKQK